MDNAREMFTFSERRASQMTPGWCAGHSVSHAPSWPAPGAGSQRYAPQPSEAEERLTESIISLATQYGRYGYRRITTLLQWDGWRVNHKRVERIRRREGLNNGSSIPLGPEHPRHVWNCNFVADRTHNGRPLRLLTVIDEYTRQCLAIRVGRRLTVEDVQECLTGLFCSRGVPEHIRSDNGPGFTCHRIRRWLGQQGAQTLFIESGSPWEPTQDAVQGTDTSRASMASCATNC